MIAFGIARGTRGIVEAVVDDQISLVVPNFKVVSIGQSRADTSDCTCKILYENGLPFWVFCQFVKKSSVTSCQSYIDPICCVLWLYPLSLN